MLKIIVAELEVKLHLKVVVGTCMLEHFSTWGMGCIWCDRIFILTLCPNQGPHPSEDSAYSRRKRPSSRPRKNESVWSIEELIFPLPAYQTVTVTALTVACWLRQQRTMNPGIDWPEKVPSWASRFREPLNWDTALFPKLHLLIGILSMFQHI